MSGSPTPYHHGNLRVELLARAEHRLEQVGPDGLSLRGLARELSVSHAAPRRHFADKEALLDALAIRGLQRLGAELDAGVAGETDSLHERLTVLARIYIRFATRHPALLALIFARKHDRTKPEIRMAGHHAFAAASALIDEAIDDGAIVDDPDLAAMAVLATVHGLAMIVTGDRIDERPVHAVISRTVHTLISGLQDNRAQPSPTVHDSGECTVAPGCPPSP
ncbi:TetR/AcrR family transcriptional regulator [Nocardia sp. CA-107356]|uniref:TetR/AcrR family transcriptional regulator n=1 Tax=Nocardia sp. CA-107356 TaxID=3239972 RepID=UPI003D942CF8